MKRISSVLILAGLFIATTVYAGWWRTFGGTKIDWGSCVQQTSDGGYIVTGFTYSYSTIPDKAEIWLIKLDSLGHTDWTKTYGEGGGSNVWQTSDGGYVIGGSKLIRTNENGDTIWTRQFEGNCANPTSDGGCIITGRIGLNLKLMKLDDKGDSIWAKLYKKGNAGNGGAFVVQTSDGGYIVTGGAVDTLDSQTYRSFLWLLKTDEVGDTQWTKSYGGEDWGIVDYGYCVRETSDGGYAIAGAVHVRGNQRYDLMKTDSQGDSLWFGVPGGGGEAYCVEQTTDGGYIVAGGTEWNTLVSSPSTASGDLWLVKTDANGDSVWARKYGGDGLDAGRYVQQTIDGGYIAVGYTLSYGAGDYDLYLLRTDSLGLLGVFEKPTPVLQCNWELVATVGSQITLQYANIPNGFNASVFDAAGRKIDVLHLNQPQGAITWGEGFPPGVYFIQVEETNYTSTAKLVLVR